MILFPGGLRSVECTVRNFSAAGARLDCGGVNDVPDHFQLKVPQKGETFDCSVIWRQLPEIGVAFRQADLPTADALADKLKTLEVQNRRLMRRLSERE
ncbi:MAG: type IV pilus assembly PilZ [Xanthobacteraceae bacterium]|nr:MAG: type IV pilus assembly PilZ [Xanthobacteraceae bacterium]